jgi:RNA polymerase sigma-70 factor (ECF subfamily)
MSEVAPEHAADLQFAQALANNEAAAIAAFETRCVPEIVQALRRMRLPDATVDEVKQALRVELLVGPDGEPRIREYAGRGALGAWLRVTATRKALKLLRATRREEPLDDLLLDNWPDATPARSDPQRAHLRVSYTAELKRAVGEAFALLAVRQRNLLRQHLLDELTIDELARLYRVHRATCARWLVDAREDLGRHTRRKLTESLGVGGDELASLLRFLDSDIELSISRILMSR